MAPLAAQCSRLSGGRNKAVTQPTASAIWAAVPSLRKSRDFAQKPSPATTHNSNSMNALGSW